MSERATRKTPAWRAAAILLAGVLAGTMLLTPVGAHVATGGAEQVNHLWNQHFKPRTDNHYAQRMWARVNSNGSLAVSRGPVTSSSQLDTGQYRVNFGRNVAGCSAQATAWSSQASFTFEGFPPVLTLQPGPGLTSNRFASIGLIYTGSSGNIALVPDALQVALRNPDGDLANAAFTLLVTC